MNEMFGVFLWYFSIFFKWALSRYGRTPNSALESSCVVLSAQMCSKIGTFVCCIAGEIKCIYKNLFPANKRSVVFICAGWISPPQRNPVYVLELHQLCFLMLCDLICPVLLPLALRLIFNPRSACASSTEPGCQLAWKPDGHTLGNTLYLVTCYSSSGMKPGTRASPSIPMLCSLFPDPSLTNSLTMSGRWQTILPDPIGVHLPSYLKELAWAGGVV